MPSPHCETPQLFQHNAQKARTDHRLQPAAKLMLILTKDSLPHGLVVTVVHCGVHHDALVLGMDIVEGRNGEKTYLLGPV